MDKFSQESYLVAAGGDDPVDPGDPVVEEVRDPPLLIHWCVEQRKLSQSVPSAEVGPALANSSRQNADES